MVFGSAVGDQISGTQTLSLAGATAINETVFNGGNLDIFLKGSVASGVTVESGGAIQVSECRGLFRALFRLRPQEAQDAFLRAPA
jgi:hypothetical protein